MTISPGLYNTLKRWLDDASSDNPPDRVRNYGLCHHVNETGTQVEWDELQELLYRDFCDTDFPFDEDRFDYSNSRPFMYKNPRRRAWVKMQIAEYEEENVR